MKYLLLLLLPLCCLSVQCEEKGVDRQVYITAWLIEFRGADTFGDLKAFPPPNMKAKIFSAPAHASFEWDPFAYLPSSTPISGMDSLNPEILGRITGSDGAVKASRSGIKSEGISGILSDPEFQVTIRSLKEKAKGLDILSLPSMMVRSDQVFDISLHPKLALAGTVSILDRSSLKLQLFLPRRPGDPLFTKKEKPIPTISIDVEDGQVVAYTYESKFGGKHLVGFIKAQLMDPAGQPIN